VVVSAQKYGEVRAVRAHGEIPALGMNTIDKSVSQKNGIGRKRQLRREVGPL
jgi:hypothetical protein